MDVKDLKVTDRPRERLERFGPKVLSDVELLAILIGSGTRKWTVFDIASHILKQYTLQELKDLTYEKLIKMNGIKKAKACQLIACFELAKRGSATMNKSISLVNPKSIYEYIFEDIYLESSEIVIAILVDCKLKPIKKIVFRGNHASQVELPVKSIVFEALEWKAYGIILAHNHPSGEIEASEADIEATSMFQGILASLDILLLEHLIVSNQGFYSMEEHGLLTHSEEYSLLGDIF